MTLVELVGEEMSVAVDHATVHVGAALRAAARASSARSPAAAATWWRRAEAQLAKARRLLGTAERAAAARARGRRR